MHCFGRRFRGKKPGSHLIILTRQAKGKVQTDEHGPWAFEEGYEVEALDRILEEWSYAYNYVRPQREAPPGPGLSHPMEFLSRWMEEGDLAGFVSKT